MDGLAFDSLTRCAATAASRRTSLFALGAALGAATLAPSLVRAGKAGKKAKKKCKRQRGLCEEFLETEFCNFPALMRAEVEAEGTPAECVEFFRPCCEFFAQCKAGEGLSCIYERAAM